MTTSTAGDAFLGRAVTSGSTTIGVVEDVLVDDAGIPVGFEIGLHGGGTRFLARHAGSDAADGSISVASEYVLFPCEAIGFYEARGARRLASSAGRRISVWAPPLAGISDGSNARAPG